MSVEQNKAIVSRFYGELWNKRNFIIADEIISPDCMTHQLQSGAVSVGVPRDAEAVKRHVSEWLSGFPDLHFAVEQMVAEEDRVVSQSVMRGTHTGSWLGIAPTNKEVTIRLMVTQRIANGKIVEDWVLVEALGFFQELGLLPTTQEIISNIAKR
jgi:predicted ester cyclase